MQREQKMQNKICHALGCAWARWGRAHPKLVERLIVVRPLLVGCLLLLQNICITKYLGVG